jgi:hypothetical protein
MHKEAVGWLGLMDLAAEWDKAYDFAGFQATEENIKRVGDEINKLVAPFDGKARIEHRGGRKLEVGWVEKPFDAKDRDLYLLATAVSKRIFGRKIIIEKKAPSSVAEILKRRKG